MKKVIIISVTLTLAAIVIHDLNRPKTYTQLQTEKIQADMEKREAEFEAYKARQEAFWSRPDIVEAMRKAEDFKNNPSKY